MVLIHWGQILTVKILRKCLRCENGRRRIIMKYYSELTKKLYDTKEDLQKAEIEITKSKADRAERAKEVEKALKEAGEANKKANKLLQDFVKDYGSFKTTIKDENIEDSSINSLFWDVFDKFIF